MLGNVSSAFSSLQPALLCAAGNHGEVDESGSPFCGGGPTASPVPLNLSFPSSGV